MAIRAVRLAIVFFIAGSFDSAFGQTAPADASPQPSLLDPAAYEQFFRQVVDLKIQVVRPLTARTFNGENITLTTPKIQDTIGVSYSDVIVLNAAAADCVAKLAALGEAARPLIFESRLQSAESGKISDAVTQQLRDLDDRHNHIVLDHVQQLKTALPDSSFEKFDAYVRAPPESKKPLIPSFEPRPLTQSAPK